MSEAAMSLEVRNGGWLRGFQGCQRYLVSCKGVDEVFGSHRLGGSGSVVATNRCMARV